MLRFIFVGSMSLYCFALSLIASQSAHAETQAVDIYSQDQLIELIRSRKHLQQVKADDCQLVQDIEARSDVLKQPMYQFLWAEMLNYGTCVKADPPRGIALLKAAAEQGSAEAMVRIAEYYAKGKFVTKNPERAVKYALPAAANGDLPGRIMLVRLFSQGYGSPRDYEYGYLWLYNAVFSDDQTQKIAMKLLKKLEARMPASVVVRAQKAHLRTH